MRPRRVRNPIEATAREPINRPDTYERFPKSCQILDCEQQPAHTSGPSTPRGRGSPARGACRAAAWPIGAQSFECCAVIEWQLSTLGARHLLSYETIAHWNLSGASLVNVILRLANSVPVFSQFNDAEPSLGARGDDLAKWVNKPVTRFTLAVVFTS